VRSSERIAPQLARTDHRFGPLLDGVVEHLSSMPTAIAVAVAGSIAAGNADLVSDLDLQLIVERVDAAAGEAARMAIHATHEVGDERWSVPNRILSTVGLDWLRVDIVLLEPGDGLDEEAALVWSRDGFVPTRRPRPQFAPDPIELTQRVRRFFRSIGLIVRDLHRDDLRLGCWATEFLVEELTSLMYLQHGLVRGPQKGAHRHLPPGDVELIRTLPVAQPERESIIDAQLAVASEYVRRARIVADEWNAEWPTAMEDATRSFLVEHLGASF
jgi:hypothetical protein